MRLLELNSARDWNNILLQLPAPHLLQTYQWGRTKFRTAGRRCITFGRKTGYSSRRAGSQPSGQPEAARAASGSAVLPKGPVLDWQNQGLAARVLDDLQTLAAQRRPRSLR
jgi:hypothetical protein